MGSLRRPLFKYFGSKWRLTKLYPEPKTDWILEPFAGSACYSLHYPDRQVVLNELNPRIAGLWRWLVTAPSDTISRLPDFAGCEGLNVFDWAEKHEFPWEAAELVVRWQRTGTNDCPTISKWNGESGLWHAATRDYIAEAVQHIKHWRVTELDWSAFAPCEITCFVDPPYQSQRPSVYRNSEGVDYNALAQWCLDPAWSRIIVCEADGADWLPFRPLKEIVNMRRNYATEAVWLNG